MTKHLEIGDRVGWNSEAGHVSGAVIRIHTRDFCYKGHTHRASRNTRSRAARPTISPRTRDRHSPSWATDDGEPYSRVFRELQAK